MNQFVVMSDNHMHLWSAFSHENEKGLNNRLGHILDELDNCAATCVAAGGKRVYGAGDLFHVRGVIPPSVINPLKDRMEAIHKSTGIEFILMPGNHDLEKNDSLKIGSATSSLSSVPGVTVIDRPRYFEEDKVAMLPWRDKMDDLRGDMTDMAAKLDDQGWLLGATLIIHAPVNGVIVGIPEKGFDAFELDAYGFLRVIAGHYHNHKQFPGTKVYSAGATTHQTWGDVDTLAGHMLITGDLVKHIESEAPKFVQYNADWDDEAAKEMCEGNYVKVTLGEASEREILEIKELVKTRFGAAACVVQATPERKIADRSETVVVSGQTVEQSVAAYVDSEEFVSDKADIMTKTADIMRRAKAVEV